jgi:hypothetical protein
VSPVRLEREWLLALGAGDLHVASVIAEPVSSPTTRAPLGLLLMLLVVCTASQHGRGRGRLECSCDDEYGKDYVPAPISLAESVHGSDAQIAGGEQCENPRCNSGPQVVQASSKDDVCNGLNPDPDKRLNWDSISEVTEDAKTDAQRSNEAECAGAISKIPQGRFTGVYSEAVRVGSHPLPKSHFT